VFVRLSVSTTWDFGGFFRWDYDRCLVVHAAVFRRRGFSRSVVPIPIRPTEFQLQFNRNIKSDDKQTSKYEKASTKMYFYHISLLLLYFTIIITIFLRFYEYYYYFRFEISRIQEFQLQFNRNIKFDDKQTSKYENVLLSYFTIIITIFFMILWLLLLF